MPPAIRKRVVLAAILKPINDTRMYEKMALSLAQAGVYQVTVIGRGSAAANHAAVHFFSLGNFGRIGLARLVAPLKVLVKCLQVKPEILIVTTHELLIVALINRILFGTRIWYDIQENYYRNIRFGGAFPPVISEFLALFVRLKEKATAPFFQGFFLAETGYTRELNFVGRRAIVLENKVVRAPLPTRKKATEFTFLFSGTLAASTGVFSAIELVRRIRETGAAVRLLIIGYAAQTSIQHRLRAASDTLDFIALEGVHELVPHTRILEAIAEAHAGIVAYPDSPHTQSAIPTKLYEYLAHQLPIVCINHPTWSACITKWQAGLSIDFENYEPVEVWNQLRHAHFYPTPPTGVFWEDEEPKLLDALQADK